VTSDDPSVRLILTTIGALEDDHRSILKSVQRSKARAATVEATLSEIQTLSPRQLELLTEAALAIRHGLYRSGTVAAFAAVVDSLHQLLARRSFLPSISAMRAWKVYHVEDLQEFGDYQVVEAARQVQAISKAQMKSVHGLLHRRNLAAHPTGYAPNLDEALGFISESLAIIRAFEV